MRRGPVLRCPWRAVRYVPFRADRGASARGERREGGEFMADIGFLGVTVVFFGLSWLLVRLCDRL
jgi:hypothetical protein